MKKCFSLFTVLILFGSFSVCNADTTNLNLNSSFAKRLNVTSSSSQSVAERANKMYSGSNPAGGISDPLMNGALGGYYNMMQGVTGGMYDPRELQRQQTDYVKQQMDKPQSADE